MNSKFIARYLALGAVAAGASAPALAQNCPLTVQCPDPNQTLATASFSDSLGEVFIPDVADPNLFLSVNQFDPAVYAALHGVSVTDITLLGVEVELSIEVTEMQRSIFNVQTACTYDWTWPVVARILANPGLGTGEIGVSPQIIGSDTQALAAGDTYSWDITNPADYTGPTSASGCQGLTTGLLPYIGNGNLSWQLEFSAFPSTTGCSNSAQQNDIKGIADLEVTYRYCYGSPPPPPPGGCECDRPSPNYRRPGSLLLYPEFDNNPGSFTLVTVTNTDCLQSSGEDVQIEFKYIDKDGCAEFNKTEVLTPCDTLTVITKAHNPGQDQGYLYVFAKKPDANAPNGVPIAWDHLVGSLMVIQGLDSGFDYSMNPVVFQSQQAAMGETTDLDGDGILDLDGLEYEPAPNVITIPRFLGQDGVPGQPGLYNSQLILIGLTGGARFETTACFTFYNDNEVVLSEEYTFECWDKPYLLDIGAAFGNDFLANLTDDDPSEIFGAPTRESGWICVTGCIANSTQESIQNPAIYAALVEHVGSFGVADLPWECGTRTNGALLPRGVFGDPDSDTDGDGDVDEDDAINGDNQ
jgi:hypothetical protein